MEPQQPRVLMDCTAIPRDLGGVGRYLERVIPALDDLGCDLVIVAQARDLEWIARSVRHATVVALPTRYAGRVARLAWEQFGLPRLARSSGATVIHSPHYTMPVLSRIPVVVTIHDATFFSDPQLHGRLKRRFFRAWTRISVRKAAVCIVPSAATSEEVVRLVHADPATLVVAHHGVDTDAFHPPTVEELAGARSAIGAERWVAFLGTLEPRKNVSNLVRAFDRLDLGSDGTKLVLAGGRGWDAELDEAIRSCRRPEAILSLGYIDSELLPGLLGGAVVVAYPSLGEGFGLPVLEAMACGAAVLTTERLALPEVGGGAVQYCGTSAEEIGSGLHALIGDATLRRRLASAALARAATFTWRATAERHREAYAMASEVAR